MLHSTYNNTPTYNMATPKKLNTFLSWLIFVIVAIALFFVYGALAVTFGFATSRSPILGLLIPPTIFALALVIRYLIVSAINKKLNKQK